MSFKPSLTIASLALLLGALVPKIASAQPVEIPGFVSVNVPDKWTSTTNTEKNPDTGIVVHQIKMGAPASDTMDSWECTVTLEARDTFKPDKLTVPPAILPDALGKTYAALFGDDFRLVRRDLVSISGHPSQKMRFLGTRQKMLHLAVMEYFVKTHTQSLNLLCVVPSLASEQKADEVLEANLQAIDQAAMSINIIANTAEDGKTE